MSVAINNVPFSFFFKSKCLKRLKNSEVSVPLYALPVRLASGPWEYLTFHKRLSKQDLFLGQTDVPLDVPFKVISR